MSQTQTAENTAAEDILSEVGNNESGKLEADDVYHLLQNERRRSVLRYMKGVDGAARMRDVAEQVAAWEYDTTVEQLTSQERQRVYIALYQAHLPKLDKHGIIDYNQSRGIVEQKPRAERLEQYIVEEGDLTASQEGTRDEADVEAQDAATTASSENADEPSLADDRDWSTYYFGTMAAAGALLVGSGLGVPVLSAVTPIAIGALLVVAFTLLAAWQWTDGSPQEE